MPTGILLGTVSIIGLIAGTPFLLHPLGKADVLVTQVQEGTAKAVMHGESFSHFLMSYEGHHLNDPRYELDNGFDPWEVIPNKNGAKDDWKYDHRNFLLKWAGVYWLGIPPFRSVYEYRFRWNEMINDDNGDDMIWARDRETRFIYVSAFPYEFKLKAAETDEGLPVDVWYQVTVRINNPYKALFDTENWLMVVTAAVNSLARDYVGHHTYKQLQSELKRKDDGTVEDTDAFSKRICALNGSLPDDTPDGRKGLSGRFGVTIDFACIQSIELTGANADKYRDATVAEFTADMEAYAIRAQGQAKAGAELDMGRARAKSTALQGTADAVALKHRLHVLKNGGKLGELLVQTDAMKADVSGKTVIWANNPFIGEDASLVAVLKKIGLPADQGSRSRHEDREDV